MKQTILFFTLLLVGYSSVWAANEAALVDTVVQDALRRNHDVQKAVADIRIAEATVEQTYGMFDLKLDGNVTYSKSVEDTSGSLFSPEETEVLSYGLSLSEKLMTAGILSLDFTKAQTDLLYNPAASAFLGSGLLNPTHEPDLALMYTQPLLKGLLGRPDLVGIRIGELNIALAKESLVQNVQDQAEALQNSLLNLDQAYAVLVIQQASLVNNQRYYDQAVRLQKIGLREEQDLLQTRAALLSAKAQITPAQNNIAAAEDTFANLAGVPAPVSPTGAEMDPAALDAVYKALRVEAILPESAETDLIDRQPAMRIAQLSLEMNTLNKTIAENSAWPELNIFGKYGITGLEGDSGESYLEMFGGQYHYYAVGVNFTVYLPNRSNQGDVTSKTQDVAKAEESLAALKETFRIQVRTAHRTLLAAHEDFALKQTIKQAYTRNLEIHNRYFNQGRISARELLQAESELNQAKLGEVQAYFTLARAIQSWQKITGDYRAYCRDFIKE